MDSKSPAHFTLGYDKIFNEYLSFKDNTEQKVTDLLILAGKTLGEYFIFKGFIFNEDYKIYYDPITKVGIKIGIPNYIDLTVHYNSINISIIYKYSQGYLEYNKGCLFFFKKEPPEKAFNRFKKFKGKTELERIKTYLRLKHPKEMLIADRAEKITNINKL